jgi:hypothetical protein
MATLTSGCDEEAPNPLAPVGRVVAANSAMFGAHE